MSEFILFLGTGAATPAHFRFAPSILVCGSRWCLLLDCGEGAQIQLSRIGFNILKLKAVAITHLHGDHVYGLLPLVDTFIMRASAQGIPAKLTIVAPKGLCEGILKNESYLSYVRCVEASALRDGYEHLEEFAVKAIPVNHGGIEAYGFLVNVRLRNTKTVSIFYSGDGVCNDECAKQLISEGPLCVVIHDATFSDYPWDAERASGLGHATIAHAAHLAQRVSAKVLVLFHLSLRYDVEDVRDFVSRAKRIFCGDIYVPEDLSLLPLARIKC